MEGAPLYFERYPDSRETPVLMFELAALLRASQKDDEAVVWLKRILAEVPHHRVAMSAAEELLELVAERGDSLRAEQQFSQAAIAYGELVDLAVTFSKTIGDARYRKELKLTMLWAGVLQTDMSYRASAQTTDDKATAAEAYQRLAGAHPTSDAARSALWIAFELWIELERYADAKTVLSLLETHHPTFPDLDRGRALLGAATND